MPSDPLISDGNSQDGIKGCPLRDAVERVATPIFEAALEGVPQEVSRESMALNKPPSFNLLWRPNNYRRQMRVKS